MVMLDIISMDNTEMSERGGSEKFKMKIYVSSGIRIYKKRLLLRCIHHFKSDLIYNMDHMRISVTEPSSVILS